MMGIGGQEILLLGVVAIFWVLPACFVASIAARGGGGFGRWLLASLVFSPFLAALGLVALRLTAPRRSEP